MSLRTPRTDLHPPSISRTFTTAGTQIVFCDNTEPDNTIKPASGAPAAGINQLPSTILVIPPAAGGTLTWKDLLGNSNSLVIPAGAAATPVIPFRLPFTCVSIEAGTSAGFQLTASWHPEA